MGWWPNLTPTELLLYLDLLHEMIDNHLTGGVNTHHQNNQSALAEFAAVLP